ncbi:Oidioi.mRNA.OKI2018_I69.chr1.g1535.t1.cds [Oikopleura dioica]|uniref:Oidioi.mRNA.OKI2018_I69.chr1.g1535.t1.cds n=1 Tax=Oikopleura dioica TaxID=34765 RepID=A0ABN7SRR5_OIKDI|nr:Oidioi.mRNA.OKI2018_I69.chr1.g1535.t1.cds [Oikopleura dioica]
MKLSVAVISAALAAREPDAGRRLAKITEKANELLGYSEDSSASDRKKEQVAKWIGKMLDSMNKIDVSACPVPGVDEDRFAVDDDFSELCEGSGKLPSMMRSYARKFGCDDGFPKKKFLDRFVRKSHKLKNVIRKAGKCPGGVVPDPSDPTDAPVTSSPIASACPENFWADCDDLDNTEIYFTNEWTCRNCFRVRATYGQNTNFNSYFSAARGDFVSVRFTEPVVWQTWNHPVSAVTEVGNDNTFKIDFKPDGNFMSGMLFEGNLQTSDDDLFVDGNWIIESAQHCRCRPGTTTTPTTTPDTTPDTTPETPETPPPCGNAFNEVEYYVDCDDQTWTTIKIEQREIEGDLLQLTMYQDRVALGSNFINPLSAYSGPITVYGSNPFHSSASLFKIRNFWHTSEPYIGPPCVPVDPCVGLDNCETYIDSCMIAPFAGNQIATTNGYEQFKISAEVRCTDRRAPTWENVLHVNTGTSREVFGDRYFTIWKKQGSVNEIRIVAPVLGNPNDELNAYVNCEEGWHTFAVQQTAVDRRQMNVEILFDGEVIESQLVRKQDVFNGSLNVEVASDFGWPAATDHYVRNFIHQDLSCPDPCFGEENCETFVDACEIFPSASNQLSTIQASANFKASIDIQCNHNMDMGRWLNIFHMSAGGEAGNPGDRFFAAWRQPNDQRLYFARGVPHGGFAEYKNVDCVDGEWNTYTLEQRQDEDSPDTVRMTFSIDDEVVTNNVYPTSDVFTGSVDVFSSRKSNPADVASEFAVRNFFYQTFEEVEPRVCEDRSDPCDGLEDCQTFIDSCIANPSASNNLGSIETTENFRTSIDIQCNHGMDMGRWLNIFHISAGGEAGSPGDRFFAGWRKPNEQQLYFALGVPEGGFAQYKTFDCVDQEWNTYVLEQRQDSSNPNIVVLTFSIDGNEIASYSYATSAVLSGTNVDVFSSRKTALVDVAWNFAVRNFYHQYFALDVPAPCTATDPCQDEDDCQTFINSCEAFPAASNQLGSINTSVNFRTSIDIQCSHSMENGRWRNIFHISAGNEAGSPGDRFFAAWKRPNNQQLYFALGVPEGGFAQYQTLDCVDGEWNTYALEQRQNEVNPNMVELVFTKDDVEIASYNYESAAVLSDTNVDVFLSRKSRNDDVAWKYPVRNFFHKSFDLVSPAPCTSSDPCDGVDDCQTFIDSCESFPSAGNQLGSINTSVNFRTSIDIQCSHSMDNGRWLNIFHISAGNEAGNPGDRFFAAWKRPNNQQLYFALGVPVGGFAQYKTLDCVDGEWNTYVLEQRQDKSNLDTVQIVFSRDGEEIASYTYDAAIVLSDTNVDVFSSRKTNNNDVAWLYPVRNFFHQSFDFCEDPCAGEENCSVIVDSCEINPSKNNQVATAPAALNYKMSADVFCADLYTVSNPWINIAHVTGGDDHSSPGSRNFAIWRHPRENKLHFHTNNPNGNHNDHSDYTPFVCTPGEWNTFTIEVRQAEEAPLALRYTVSIDGAEVKTGLYSSTGALTSGDLQFFVGDPWYNAASGYFVRNFIYQTFEDRVVSCDDPCEGEENCVSVVDSCGVNPTKNTEVATAPAALNYKISADVFCAELYTVSNPWINVIHVTGGDDRGTPGSRTFAMWRHPRQNKLHLHTNNPNGNHNDHSDYTPFVCTAGEWNNFSVEVRQVEGSPSTLSYVVSIDGTEMKTGTYSSTGALTSGDLQFFVADPWYNSADGYFVKNVVYQTFEEI